VKNLIDISTQLKQNLDCLTKELKDNPQGVIDDAIDILLCKFLGIKEIVGFDIGITMGGPVITLVYSRGSCQLR
jgi:predicted nucleic acid-binding protein